MKKINLLLMGVLFSTLAFANGTEKPAPGSSVAVTNASGSTLVKLFYKSPESGDVKVTITDSSDNIVFSEKIKSTDGFLRPYNFEGLSAGEYNVSIEDNTGTHRETIVYNVEKAEKAQKLVGIIRMAEDGKFVITAHPRGLDKINVNVYDESSKLVYSKEHAIKTEFAALLNIKGLSSFTIEVSDRDGVVKSLKY